MQRRRFLLGSAAGAALWSLAPLAAACDDDDSKPAKAAEARADIPRVVPADADRADAKALASEDAIFGWDLYAKVTASAAGNVFCSPHSIS
jgi:serine protease inhibitor